MRHYSYAKFWTFFAPPVYITMSYFKSNVKSDSAVRSKIRLEYVDYMQITAGLQPPLSPGLFIKLIGLSSFVSKCACFKDKFKKLYKIMIPDPILGLQRPAGDSQTLTLIYIHCVSKNFPPLNSL